MLGPFGWSAHKTAPPTSWSTKVPDLTTVEEFSCKSWHLIQYSESQCTYDSIKEWKDQVYRLGCMEISKDQELEVSFIEVHSHTGGIEFEYTITGKIAKVL